MNEKFIKGQKPLNEGKTKIIWPVKGKQDLVIMENKTAITADNDPTKTKDIATKAISATSTTARVFELLNKAGVPTAYLSQISSTEILARNCEMIPLEVIIRRYAVGSYLKRKPEFKRPDGELPYRFHSLCFEVFLKTTEGGLKVDDDVLIDGLTPQQDDPFIINPYDAEWKAVEPKKVYDGNVLGTVNSAKVLNGFTTIEEIEALTRKAFLILEGAWNILGYRLFDFKIEFGIDLDGKLVIADVIDNDSWRLRTNDWKELSKQLFRDGHDLAHVEEAYAIVAKLVHQFRIPKQALVLWRGSKDDQIPVEFLKPELGYCLEDVVISGHKSPSAALAKLEELHTKYPDGGVIIPIVGMSNGLGPILAARTDWPVISVCYSADANPNDVWSCLRMPSKVPNATMLSSKNAVLFAWNLLAQKNPLIYADRRLAIEKEDY